MNNVEKIEKAIPNINWSFASNIGYIYDFLNQNFILVYKDKEEIYYRNGSDRKPSKKIDISSAIKLIKKDIKFRNFT